MQIRLVRLPGRHPLVAVALALVLFALLAAVVVFGLTVFAALAALGGLTLLARRALGLGRPRPAAPVAIPRAGLDPADEVFPPGPPDAPAAPRRLPLPLPLPAPGAAER